MFNGSHDTPMGWALVDQHCVTPGKVVHSCESTVFKTIQTCNNHPKVVNVFPERGNTLNLDIFEEVS